MLLKYDIDNNSTLLKVLVNQAGWSTRVANQQFLDACDGREPVTYLVAVFTGANDVHVWSCIYSAGSRQSLLPHVLDRFQYLNRGWLPVHQGRSGGHHDSVHHH